MPVISGKVQVVTSITRKKIIRWLFVYCEIEKTIKTFRNICIHIFIYVLYKNLNASVNRYISPILPYLTFHINSTSGLWPSGNLFLLSALFLPFIMISFVFSLFFRWLPSLFLRKKRKGYHLFFLHKDVTLLWLSYSWFCPWGAARISQWWKLYVLQLP